MRILITGASGYIGSILWKKLSEQGYDVSGVDLKDPKNKLPKFYKLDYDDINADGFDIIYHLAASSLLGPSVKDPLSYYVNNTAKTTLFLDRLTKSDFNGRFIFASSAAIYGDIGTTRCQDGPAYNQFWPINPYGMSKLQTEHQMQDLAISKPFAFFSMRFFNVVGAYENLGQQLEYPHILTSLCRAAYNQDSFYINGNNFFTPDLTCIRDYIHVEDVVDLLILSGQLDKKAVIQNYFNVSTDLGTSNLELFNLFREITGKNLDLKYKQQRPGDPSYLVGQNYSIQNQFQFKPKYDIESMIKSAWKYYQESQHE